MRRRPGNSAYKLGRAPFRIRHSPAFSLLEVLVAVGLLSVIIVGLLSMFYQTDKAFRLGTRQVDVLETGRSVMGLLARELQELADANDYRVVNLYVSTTLAPLVQNRPGTLRTNILQDYYFLIRSNDLWTGVGYFIDPVGNGGVGSLYRYSTTYPGMIPDTLPKLYADYQAALATAPANWNRVADNIIHLRIIPYDKNGISFPFGSRTGTYFMTNLTLLRYGFPFVFPSEQINVPSAIDLEIAILEPRTLARYRAVIGRFKTSHLWAVQNQPV